jgi:hypothetical protein
MISTIPDGDDSGDSGGGSGGDSGGGGNTAPKTLVIRNIPATVYAYGQSGGKIGVFPAGTTPEQAMSMTGIIAGADLSNRDVSFVLSGSTYTLTIPLYNITNDSRWTGSRTSCTVYVMLFGDGGHFYKADSVSITSGTTTVSFNSAEEITANEGGGGDGGGGGGGGNNAQKTLVIQNIPQSVYDYGQAGGGIGVFPGGTSPEQAISGTDIVAVNGDIVVSGSGPYTLTVLLYDITNDSPWTGNGPSFTVYVALFDDNNNGRYYRVDSVSITSGTTTIDFNTAEEVKIDNYNPGGGGDSGAVYPPGAGIPDTDIDGKW